MRLVRVRDLFDVHYGVNLDLNKLDEVPMDWPNAIPYVGRSAKNNGITAYVEQLEDVTPNPPMTISVAGGGAVMSCFLQERPYYSGRDLFYLKPKKEMSKQMLLYYCTALSMNRFKFSYGRQANKTLRELLVPSVTEIPREILDYPLGNGKGIQDFGRLCDEVLPVALKLRSQKTFKTLGEIFDLVNGVPSADVVVQPTKEHEFLVPYVRPSKWQSTSYAGYVDSRSVPKNKVFPANTLYVSTDGAGSHTYAYVSVEAFIPNSNVVVLIPKQEMSLHQKLVYATLISANRFKFSYGRKPKGDKLKNILLPVITD